MWSAAGPFTALQAGPGAAEGHGEATEVGRGHHMTAHSSFFFDILITFDLFQSNDPDDAGALRSLPLVPARLTGDGSSPPPCWLMLET